MANYINLNNGKVLTECELYDFLACGCSRKNYTKFRWENETTHVNKLGREWWKIWEVTPPSGCGGECIIPSNTVSPALTGTGEYDTTLTTNNGTWSGTLPITYSYQWYRDGIEIIGETTNEYLLTEEDINTEIWCIVTATNACGEGTGESNHVLCYSEPLALTAPQTSGSLLVGGTITRVAGTYAGSAPITLTYQWLDGSNNVLGTGTSYVVQQADFGGTIHLKEIATNAHGSINQSTSNQTIISAPINTAINTTSGNDYVGQVRTTTDGTWIGTAPITYGYQWQRDGVDILGATASTYTLVALDSDKDIRCVVTATNTYGSATATSATFYAFTAEYEAIRVEGVAIGATAPSTAIQKKENKIITQMISASMWTPADLCGNFASDGDNLWKSMNWKNPSGNKFLFNGSGTMVSLEGYKLNGTDAWIDSRLNLNSATKYTTSNSCIGIYSAGKNLSKGITGGMLWGASDGTFQAFMNNQAAATGVWEGRMGSGTTRVTTDIRKAEGHYSQEYNGTNTIIRVGSSNYTTAQTGAYTRANFNLGFGCRNKTVPDQFSNGTIAFIYVGDATLGAGMRTILDAVMPTIFPTPTAAVLQGDCNPNNTATLWQDVAKTIPVTSTSDPVRVVEMGAWGDMVAGADAERPLFTLSALNSLPILDFDGSNDSFDFPSSITGDHTLLWVVKNDDASNGSHIIYGSNYVPLTGSSYSGNSSYSGEYFVPHPSGTATGGVRVKNQSLAYNVIGVRLNGQEWTSINGLCESVKASSANSFSWTKLGKEYLAGWQLDGKLGRFIYYSGALTDKQLQDLIITLNTTYAL